MGIKSIALAATVLVLPASVNAAIISTDWNAAGDSLITHDTVSGLNWLDLTETNNISYNAVVSQLGAGGTYDGFRVATSAEVVALWANFGVDLSVGAATSATGLADPAVYLAAGYVGDVMNVLSSAHHGAGGLTSDIDGQGKLNYIGASYNTAVTPIVTYYALQDRHTVKPTSTLSYAGTYLVSAVPIPAAVWLFGSGLVGLIGVARRKKS